MNVVGVVEAIPFEHYLSATDLIMAEGKMSDVIADYYSWRRAMFKAFRRPKVNGRRVLTPTKGYWKP